MMDANLEIVSARTSRMSCDGDSNQCTDQTTTLPKRRNVFEVAPVLAALLLTVTMPCANIAADENGQRWQRAMDAFEQHDRENGIQTGGILFVGSSSIRGWNTNRDFPDRVTLNRGFGGSQMSDVLNYYDRLITPYQPRVVVLYEGDNDIADGKSAAQVFAEFQQIANRFHRELPDSRLIFLSIKPSLSRWHLYTEMKSANDLIAQYCQRKQHCDMIDVSQVMLGDDGKPRPELYIASERRPERANAYGAGTSVAIIRMRETNRMRRTTNRVCAAPAVPRPCCRF